MRKKRKRKIRMRGGIIEIRMRGGIIEIRMRGGIREKKEEK